MCRLHSPKFFTNRADVSPGTANESAAQPIKRIERTPIWPAVSGKTARPRSNGIDGSRVESVNKTQTSPFRCRVPNRRWCGETDGGTC